MLLCFGLLLGTGSVASYAPRAAVQRPATLVRRHRPAFLFINETPSRVVALADVHGDADALRSVLSLAGLLDEATDRWCGGDATLVQLGDILDRGAEEAECFELLWRLDFEARAAGGRVVCLLGNHEIMNVAGRATPFVHARGRFAFGPDRIQAWRQGGPLATALADCPVVAIVGDSAFVHAHLPRSLTRDSLALLNAEMRDWLLDPLAPPPSWVWGGDESPVWDRRLSSGGEPYEEDCEDLRGALAALNVSRLVVGHTPQAPGINCACGGKVWRCDTGMSRWVVGGPCEALEIMPDGDVRILSERRMPAPAVGPPVATPAGRQKPAPSSQCDEEECVVEEVFLN